MYHSLKEEDLAETLEALRGAKIMKPLDSISTTPSSASPWSQGLDLESTLWCFIIISS